ncbi:hypothetical protein QQX98_008101 [Neonectria punicea]|uniref:Monooxygenase n=1 Tax=Neonectria punicea TaxID=979145 RepID=A0ABR1GWG8_9HYPO
MKRPEFQPKLAFTPEALTFLPTTNTFVFFKDSFKFNTIVLIGALLQLALCAILPLRWAVVPAISLLLNSSITTFFQARSPLSNEYKTHVVPGRVTAQVPSIPTATSSCFGSQPANASIVVFNIGSQFNHPLGVLAPGVKEMGERFDAMLRDMNNRREDLGLLGASHWIGDERTSNNTNGLTCHFRDLEGLHRFAHEPLHRETWDWFNSKKYPHIGVFHETYCVPAKSYETVYLNCRPILMGRVTTKVTNEGEEPQWANALVNADTPALKTQYSRMARDEKGNIKEDV